MSDRIVPTIRIVCDKCADDMICTEKAFEGYRFHCPKCGVKIRMLTGWVSQ